MRPVGSRHEGRGGGKLNRGHCPHIYIVAAQEAETDLQGFAALPALVQRAYIDYALNGPSKLRDRLNTQTLVNLRVMQMSNFKHKPDIESSGLLDGLVQHPEITRRERAEKQEEASLQNHLAMARRAMGIDGGQADEAEEDG